MSSISVCRTLLEGRALLRFLDLPKDVEWAPYSLVLLLYLR
jgi:hypothetical protein